MVEGALRLLDERDIDQISVRDIVGAAGTSYGSFYHRFGTKEHFFNYLIDDMISRRERDAMLELSGDDIAFDHLPEMLGRSAIANFRQHAGLLRSAVRRHIAGDGCWRRISKMSRRVVEKYIERVERALGRDLSDGEARQVSFAFVWLYGLLAYGTLGLNSFYGYALTDELFEQETIRNFRQLIHHALPVGTPYESGAG